MIDFFILDFLTEYIYTNFGVDAIQSLFFALYTQLLYINFTNVIYKDGYDYYKLQHEN